MERRKASSLLSSGYASDNLKNGTNLLSSNPDVTYQDHNTITPVAFKYGKKLFILLIPPVAVMLAFGGRPTLLAFCFGAISTYIFDLLASIEGAFMSIIMTLLAVWGTLLWASRLLLQESILNLSMVIIMGALLVCIFFVICGHFDMMVDEFDSILWFCESFLFAVIPLLSSVLLTWFITVEIPATDVSICFSFIYFVYMIHLSPSRKSHLIPATLQSKLSGLDCLVLPQRVVIVLYALPMVLVPILSISSHHYVLFTSWNNSVSLIVSFLMPLLLMIICFEQESEHFKTIRENYSVEIGLELVKLVGAAVLVCCYQSHPFLDDLKSLAFKQKSYISIAICLLAFNISLTVGLNRLQVRYQAIKNNAHSLNMQVIRTFVYISASGCALLLASILQLPAKVFPVTAGGGLCLAAYYFKNKSSSTISSRDGVITVFYLFIASWSAAITFQFFLDQTLSSLTILFSWIQDVTIQRLCFIAASLVGFGVLIPAIGHWIKIQTTSSIELLPSGSSGRQSLIVPPHSFEILFQFAAMFVSAIELLIREQNWGIDLDIDVEEVYPAYLLMATGLLIGFTAYHCWTISLMRISAVWLVWLSQSIKLLHLLGLSTNAAGAVGALVYAVLSPFISLYQSDGSSSEKLNYQDTITMPTMFNSVAMVYQICQAAFSIYLFYRHNAYQSFSILLPREPIETQVVAGCVAIFTAFLSTYCFFYIPELVAIRTFTTILCTASTLIATGSLGLYQIKLDRSASTLLVITSAISSEDLKSDSEISGICVIISAFLIIAATFNIFPVKKPIYRLLFLGLFSYTTTEALLGWSYPLSLSIDSPDHGIFHFPFIHTVVLVVLTTSAGLHSTLPKQSDMGEKIFYVILGWIVAGVVWCILFRLSEQLDGVLWSAMVASSTVAIATRISQVLRHLDGLKARKLTYTSTATTVCGLSAVIAVLSAVGLSVIGHKQVNLDFLVPISSTILMTTKKDLFVLGVHPAELSVVTCIVWWILRTLYSVFIDGFGDDKVFDSFLENFGIFHNANISIWTSPLSSWLILANLVMMLLPLPAVILSFSKRKDESEEVIIVLVILSMISLIGAQANCVRFIGGFAAVYASWRCYEIVSKSVISSRII